MRHRLLAIAAVIVCPMPSIAAAPARSKAPTDAAETIRIDPSRIDASLRQMVAAGRVAGASVLIWKNGREVYFSSAGWADREARKPIRRDTMFQIWSMTKPVTGVGLMRLWEQGRFGLDDPLHWYLPEFSRTKVFAGTDAAGKPILKAPDRPILVRDILRHTAGLGYDPGTSFPGQRWKEADPLNLGHDLAQFSARLATVPLLFDPGRRWSYSAAVDVQARLIEKLSGQPFEDYMQAQLLRPLGMTETAWTQPERRYSRLAVAYAAGPEGKLVRKSEADLRAFNFSDRKLTMGGAGLAGTIDDYMRFARMLLNRGSLGGVRIVKPSTVKLMATDQLDHRVTDRSWLVGKGNGGFGIDLFVRTGQPLTPGENRGATGEFFWDGAWSTLFWVDPANDMAVVFLTQKDPFDGTLHRDIRAAVYGPSYLGPKGD